MKTLVGMAVCAVLLIGLGADAFAAHSDHGCANCHVAHRATTQDPDGTVGGEWGVPLWSPHQLDDEDGLKYTYDLYSTYGSTTLNATLNQPNGPSKLCLGCHDGTYMSWPSNRVFTNDQANDMTLSHSHPVSFKYDAALVALDDELEDPAQKASGVSPTGKIKDDLLDNYSYMQCSGCHDVHTSGKTDFMLRWDVNVVYEPDDGDPLTTEHALHIDHDQAMCRTCHKK